MTTRIWNILKTSLLISLLFSLITFGGGVERISVAVDKNYYKIFIKLSSPSVVRVTKDPKRDLIAVELRNDKEFSKSFYSVVVKGSKNLVTILVKNPNLDTSRASVRVSGRGVFVFIPFKGKFSKYVVVIDPGHGGKDGGATYYGVKEKEINLAIAKKLYALLKRDGRFEVYMTRYDDRFVSLTDRQLIAAKVGADLFLSIHSNAAPRKPSATGVKFYILSDEGIAQKFLDLARNPQKALNFFSRSVVWNRSVRYKVIKSSLEITRDQGEELAEFLCSEWQKLVSRYIPCNGIYERAFAVLKVPGVPSVLVETGFMTNKRELEKLKDSFVQWKIAESLYLGILDYFNLQPPDWIKDKVEGSNP